VFGAGIALGVLIGAGAALLFAPQSGSETRDEIMRGTRDFGFRATDAWEDLREELRHAATRGAKRLRRGVRRGRHSTEDLVGTVRRQF
jgi:gas vesicle protein